MKYSVKNILRLKSLLKNNGNYQGKNVCKLHSIIQV